ncbi:hypothetical protein ABNF31_19965, partial [Paenibacillus larvae]
GYEYGSFHFLEPSFLHNYTDSTEQTYIPLLLLFSSSLALVPPKIPIIKITKIINTKKGADTLPIISHFFIYHPNPSAPEQFFLLFDHD